MATAVSFVVIFATEADAGMHIQTIWVIMMENRNWSEILGSKHAPYINKVLLPIASHAEQYFNPPQIHPSLPNYLWLEAGTNFGILDDEPPKVHGLSSRRHLVSLLEQQHVTWKAYEESISGKRCPLADKYPYGVRHDPFVYFDGVTHNREWRSRYCIAHIRPFRELARDLASNHVASYNFITPNVCHDMHDRCKPIDDEIAQGDMWLAKAVPTIMHSSAYKRGGAIFITWDEAALGDGPIGMIVISPYAKGKGYHNSLHYTHGSTLRTIQEIFGVKPFLCDADRQQDLRDLFSAFP